MSHMLASVLSRQYYEAKHDENLMDRIRSELGDKLEYLCIRLFQGARGQVGGPPFDAEAVATSLYEEGPNKWGTDPREFIDALTNHTLLQVREICKAYERKYNSSLESVIQSEFSGEFEKALVSLLYDPIDLYCRNLKEATDGLGTTESVISRILGGNDKATVQLIAKRYFEKYDESLVAVLNSELFYDYRNACVTYVETSDITGGVEEKLTALELDAHNPPPPPAPRKRATPPSPPPKKEKPEDEMSGAEAAVLVGCFTAAVLIGGPVVVVGFGVLVIAAAIVTA